MSIWGANSRRLIGALLFLVATLPSIAWPSVIGEVEPDNTLATAQNVDGHFSLDASPNIGDGATSPSNDTSTTIPHVTITGSGNGTFDYYKFTFPGPGSTFGTIHIDIDFPSSSFDSWVGLWDAAGNLLGHNDDYDFRGGRAGSVVNYGGNMSFDSFMTTFLITPGTYEVGVAQSPASPAMGGFTAGSGEIAGTVTSYTLQVSVENVPVPEPATSLGLLGLGAIAFLRRRIREQLC